MSKNDSWNVGTNGHPVHLTYLNSILFEIIYLGFYLEASLYWKPWTFLGIEIFVSMALHLLTDLTCSGLQDICSTQDCFNNIIRPASTPILALYFLLQVLICSLAMGFWGKLITKCVNCYNISSSNNTTTEAEANADIELQEVKTDETLVIHPHHFDEKV